MSDADVLRDIARKLREAMDYAAARRGQLWYVTAKDTLDDAIAGLSDTASDLEGWAGNFEENWPDDYERSDAAEAAEERGRRRYG